MKLYRNERVNERVNDYFKNYAIYQIEVAHRILEYLEPDEYFFPKNLKREIMDNFLKRDVDKAVLGIIEELNINISSSSGSIDFEKEAIEFANSILPNFFERKKRAYLYKREQLLIRIGELNAELEKLE